MMYVFNETYQSAIEIPSPMRKWFIERFNKQKEKENKSKSGKNDDPNQPLSQSERMKFLKKNK